MNYKQLAINTSVALGVLAIAFLLWEFRHAALLFFLSLAIAAAARPYVDVLVRRGISSALSILIVYVLFITLLALIFWAVGSSLVAEIQRLSNEFVVNYDRIWAAWPKGNQVEQFIISKLPPPQDLYNAFSSGEQSTMVNSVLGFTLTSASLIGEAFTVLVLSIYWSIDRVHFERLWLSLLPVESRARARDIWRAIDRDFGAYVRSEVLQSIFAGLILGFGLWAIGIRFPTLLAVFAAFAWLIPWLGGILVVLAVGLTGFSQGIGLGILASIFAVGVLFFLEFFIEPRFIRRRQFSSLLSVLIIIALIEPYGLFGLLVAPPLAAAIELIFRYNLQSRPLPFSIQSSEQISQLRIRVAQVRQAVKNNPSHIEPQTANMLERLDRLIDQSEDAIEAQSLHQRRRRRASV